MGHWGTAILSNDTSADIQDLFFDLYDKEHNSTEIRKEVEKQFKEGENLSENIDFWLTLGLLQWQIGKLDNDVKKAIEEIVDNETLVSQENWK